MSRYGRRNVVDRTRNMKSYRITARWPGQGRPVVIPTREKAVYKRQAKKLASEGAYVVVAEHRDGQWREVLTVDGPAMAAEKRAAEQAEAEALWAERDRRIEQARAARKAAHLDARALMAAPGHARRETGRARHTAGGRR